MTDKRLVTLIQRLNEKTRRREIQWEKTIDEGVFQTAFRNYAIRIFARPGLYTKDDIDYVLEIYNQEGELIEQMVNIVIEDDALGADTPQTAEEDEEGMPARPVSTDPLKTMRELYTNARRSAMDYEKALDSLLHELEEDTVR